MDEKLKKAFQIALDARKNSYSPFSKFKVGASLVLKNGKIVGGCNVENASFGATICAERNAFHAAIGTYGIIRPKFLVLVTDPVACPCGMCLQVMGEFCDPEFKIFLATPKGIKSAKMLSDFMPLPFKAESFV